MNIPLKFTERCTTEYFCELKKIKSQAPSSLHKTIMNINKKVVDNFYVTYPFFFYTHYEDLDEEKIFSLTKCGNIFMTYILILDNTLDKDNPPDNSTLIFLHYLHQNTIIELFKLFPTDALFWSFYTKYETDFFSTDFSFKLNKINILKFENFIGDIIKRNSFAKCATAGLLSLVSNNNTEVDPFVTTQDFFHVGLQLLDDLEDWKEDFRKKRYSYLLAKSLSDPILNNALKQRTDRINIIGKYIYYSGLATDILDLAISYFKMSLDSISSFNIPYWKSFLEKFIYNTKKHRDEISCLIDKKFYVKKIHGSFNKNDPMKTPYNDKLNYDSIKSALGYLKIEILNDLVEMEHIMELPDFSKGINPQYGKTVKGKLFQRTILLDLLFDINDLQTNLFSEKIINNELNNIINSKMKTVRGGWNYFSEYEYLPPDTDDLAQVIQVLVKSKRNRIKEHIDDSIGLLLNHNTYQNHTFNTWILDPGDNNPIQTFYKTVTKDYWGNYCGKDIEVTANMLYALAIYNKEKYSKLISKGIDSILDFQNLNGTWSSIWYWYNFYGTYVAVRLLSYLKTKLITLESTAKYLKDNQNKDGGWGNKLSDPMSTAFSILILIDIRKTGYDIDIEIFNRAINYLLSQQKKSGAWDKVPFIKMKVGDKFATYKSASTTTVFVLKALCQLLKANIKLI